MNSKNLVVIIIILGTLFIPLVNFAADIPSAGDSGLTEKLLRQSRPPSKPPEKEKPEIIIRDSRTLKDPGAGPAFLVKRIVIEGNTIFDNETLAPMVDVGEGMELTLGILSLMASEVTAYYSSRGYFLTRVYVPKQEVLDGVVKIIVSEGKINKLQITGNKKTKEKDFLKRLKKIKKEKVLKEQTLEQVLTELNELLGIKVRSVLRPGDLPGTSDLILEVTETPPYTL
ncbi:MAG: POTRA domain-containing protein, partial [Nitrospinota bacterium]|nr:POTRA domain-containing protein [Nitrospinota bacterium]